MKQKTTIYYEGSLYFQIQGARRYYVSRAGSILSNVGKPCLMKPSIQTKGYRQVELYLDNGKPSRFLVHRLVAERFLSPVAGKDQVNHKDGNQLNNHVDNLEWVTNLENNRHARELRFKRTRQLRFFFWN